MFIAKLIPLEQRYHRVPERCGSEGLGRGLDSPARNAVDMRRAASDWDAVRIRGPSRRPPLARRIPRGTYSGGRPAGELPCLSARQENRCFRSSADVKSILVVEFVLRESVQLGKISSMPQPKVYLGRIEPPYRQPERKPAAGAPSREKACPSKTAPYLEAARYNGFEIFSQNDPCFPYTAPNP